MHESYRVCDPVILKMWAIVNWNATGQTTGISAAMSYVAFFFSVEIYLFSLNCKTILLCSD